MLKLTIFVGILALLAISMPDLVLLGFFLIVPGIVLMAAPTAFAYLVSSTLIRSLLPIRWKASGVVISVAASIMLGYLVALPFQMTDIRHYQTAILKDRVSDDPVKIRGHLRVLRNDGRRRTNCGPATCDYLCAALLCVPGVDSVTVVEKGSPESTMNWRLAPRDGVAESGLYPQDPGEIFRHCSRQAFEGLHGTERMELDRKRRRCLNAEWNLRLATQQTLVANTDIPTADFTISMTHSRDRSKPRVQRVSISDRNGETIFRRSLVQHAVIQAPLHFSFHGSFGGSRFRLGRKLLSTGDRHESIDLVRELITHVAGLHQNPADDAPRRVNQRLVAALDTRDGNPRGLTLAVPWLAELDAKTLSSQQALIARRIVADLRIKNVGKGLMQLFPKQAPVEYRPFLVQRIIAPETSSTDRRYFAVLLANMPAGTFADMTEQEWQLIRDPELRVDTVPFIERMADLGEAGVAPLISVLRDAVTKIPHWNQRRPTTDAVCRGFTRMGNQAGGALPLVRSLFEKRPSPITNSAGDALKWRIAMARMGLAIEELPYPSGWSEHQIARMRENVASRLARFDSTK